MKKSLIYRSLLATLVLLISSISFLSFAQNGVNVEFEPTNCYFVHQNAKKGTLKLVIKNQKELDDVFGIAVTGPVGRIDFDRYFMIAYVVPQEIAQVRVKPVSLKRDGKKLYFTYEIDMKDRTGSGNRSYAAILVDRKEPTKVVFQEASAPNDIAKNDSKGPKSLRDQLNYVTTENEQLKNYISELEAQKDYYQKELWKANEILKELKNENDQLKKKLRY